MASAWAVIGQLGVTFIPASVYHFTVGTLEIYSKHKSRVWLAWLVSGFFFVTALYSDAFISGVSRFWWGYYARYEWASVPFLGFFFGLMALSLQHYWQGLSCRGTRLGKTEKQGIIHRFLHSVSRLFRLPRCVWHTFLPVRSPGRARFHHLNRAGGVAL